MLKRNVLDVLEAATEVSLCGRRPIDKDFLKFATIVENLGFVTT